MGDVRGEREREREERERGQTATFPVGDSSRGGRNVIVIIIAVAAG